MKKKDLKNYDLYVVAFSGGKDSLACLLELIDKGVPANKIELWHHSIDGREGSTLMDWPVTESYCEVVAKHLGILIYFSWKEGGFEREMTRDNDLTAPCWFEYPYQDDNQVKDGHWIHGTKKGRAKFGGVRGKLNTRNKFPQVAADLRVRWCSAYLKIDVCSKALNNQPRLYGKRTLFLTGERAEESSARAKYETLEPHKSDKRDSKTKPRFIDHWRPVHGWKEDKVWDLIEKYKIVPHPAYLLGWSRLSCMSCIFGNADQWASVRAIAKAKLKKIADYEKSFRLPAEKNNGKEFAGTINRKYNVMEMADRGTPYASITDELVKLALAKKYTGKIVDPNWKLPAGAFGESGGPT